MNNRYNSNTRRFISRNQFFSRSYSLLAGTASVTLGDATRTITGVATAFLANLVVGDIVFVGTERFTIESVTNNLQAIATTIPTTNQAGQPVQRMPGCPIYPPALFQLNMGSNRPNFFVEHNGTLPTQRWNRNGNISIHAIGLFCNLADGLVFSNPTQRFNIILQPQGVQESILTGTIVYTTGSPVATGTNFIADLAAGMIVVDPNGHPFYVDTVLDDTHVLLGDYARVNAGPNFTHILTVSSFNEIQLLDVGMLNNLYDFDFYFPCGSFLLPTDTRLIIGVQVDASDVGVDFHTLTIDTAFAGTQAIFDVHADIEFTPA
jgi:hypothetical protein